MSQPWAHEGPPGVPPHWLNHVLVEALSETREKAVQHGGRLMLEERWPCLESAVISLFQP